MFNNTILDIREQNSRWESESRTAAQKKFYLVFEI